MCMYVHGQIIIKKNHKVHIELSTTLQKSLLHIHSYISYSTYTKRAFLRYKIEIRKTNL